MARKREKTAFERGASARMSSMPRCHAYTLNRVNIHEWLEGWDSMDANYASDIDTGEDSFGLDHYMTGS
jgi:hypothetical protein